MRKVQWYGLHPDAKSVLEHRGLKSRFCSHCGRSDGASSSVYDTFEPAFQEEHVLLRYYLTDEDFAIEKVQRVLWEDGPWVFLELRMFHGLEREPYAVIGWPEETMLAALSGDDDGV